MNIERLIVVAGVVVFALVGVTLLSGCQNINKDLGVAGAQPGGIVCKGKISITGMGQTNLVVAFGGNGNNSWSISGDCGDGAYLVQGKASDLPLTTPPAPASAAPSSAQSLR